MTLQTSLLKKRNHVHLPLVLFHHFITKTVRVNLNLPLYLLPVSYLTLRIIDVRSGCLLLLSSRGQQAAGTEGDKGSRDTACDMGPM